MDQQKNDQRKKICGSSGFALVSILLFTPLFLTLLLSLTTVIYIFKYKSLTQSICAQNAAVMQSELKLELKNLLRMNKEARRLQKRRSVAEHALDTAIHFKNPTAIAVAEAALTAVRLAQLHLRTRQSLVLATAREVRSRGERQWRSQMGHLKTWNLTSTPFFPLSLAVRPHPLVSDSPEYLPVEHFPFFQQQAFSYWTDLTPPFFNNIFSIPKVQHRASCAATLIEKEGVWSIDLHAANAPSRSW